MFYTLTPGNMCHNSLDRVTIYTLTPVQCSTWSKIMSQFLKSCHDRKKQQPNF